MKHVLKPIEPPYTPEVARKFKEFPQGKDGYIIALFRVFANSMRFLDKKGVLNLLDKQSPLSLRDRELVILRVTANKNCEYEWGVHVASFSKAAGLTKEQVAATRLGRPDQACWPQNDTLLLKCVDELCLHAKIQDDTLVQFQDQWSLEQQLEIMALCGNYHTICFVANTSRLPGEEMGSTFPQTTGS
jgi:alkylhydroperoxidase/carboxymuconolactone decarboxylase family protein YurZ